MVKNIRWLLAVCLLAIAGLIVLQFYWIRNYYKTSLFNFERETNLAFEDAIKKDFLLRCDTIEQQLVKQLMDTSAFTISSRRQSSPDNKIVHYVSDAKNKKDYTAFSQFELPDSLAAGDTAYKRKIAQRYARNLRTEDLESHVVYYRIQSLGHFMLDKVREYGFDTSRLRSVLKQQLEQRGIYTRFHFYLANADSLLNYTNLPDSLKKGVVITKAQPTYKWWAQEEQYVRAAFGNLVGYVFAKMKWILAGSLLLVVLVALCIWLLLKALFHEKKLAAIKNDFINNITHELKTPVATISAAVEALQDFDLNREKHSRYLGHAKNETNRLAILIDNILNISLYGNNKIPVQPEQIEIAETIHEISENLKIATNKPVRYQYINNTGVYTLIADRQLFQQALVNVLDNAIKYSGNEAEITITCHAGNRYLHIYCKDKGEGIAASSIQYVFEKFYREPKPNHAVKGYGLGLNYVQEIMKVHNGKIELSSVKDKGTTVILSWPL
jgi:two-component system phosphate regulon sensor histidine kinase PhoR